MGSLFDEDEEGFDLAAVEARHKELEAEEKFEQMELELGPSDQGIYPESDWEAIVEAVLFTMGNSVELRQLAIAIDQSEKVTKRVVESLKERYSRENRGMQIIEL